MHRVRQRAKSFDRLPDRVVVDAQPFLLLDDLPFGVHGGGKQTQAPHALGLQLDGEVDRRRWHGLVKRGDIFGRESIDLATHLLQQTRVVFRRHVNTALEHHVFEHVCHAPVPDVFVLGTHVVKDLHRRHGRLVIRQEQNLETVAKLPGPDVEDGEAGRAPRRGRRSHRFRAAIRQDQSAAREAKGQTRDGNANPSRHSRARRETPRVPTCHGRVPDPGGASRATVIHRGAGQYAIG